MSNALEPFNPTHPLGSCKATRCTSRKILVRGTLHIRVIEVLEVMEDGELEEWEELREAVIPIFEVVWRDLRRLLLPGGTAEFRRCLVTQALVFGNVHGLKDMLRENDVVISLTMHCWMNMFTFSPKK